MDERFLRAEMLLGPEAMSVLSGAHVAVLGLGGVGSWCAEALARTGVGALTLADHDTVGLSNLNRQAEATVSTLGRPKAQAMAERAADINPECRLTVLAEKYEPETRERFFGTRYDYVVDCIDLVSCKLDLIETALSRGLPILSSLGTGNKLDPCRLEVTDLSKTYGCPLARVMRRELGRRNVRHLKVVFSPEEPAPCAQLESPPPGRRSVPGSVPWVPSVAGLLMGGAIVMDLVGQPAENGGAR